MYCGGSDCIHDRKNEANARFKEFYRIQKNAEARIVDENSAPNRFLVFIFRDGDDTRFFPFIFHILRLQRMRFLLLIPRIVVHPPRERLPVCLAGLMIVASFQSYAILHKEI